MLHIYCGYRVLSENLREYCFGQGVADGLTYICTLYLSCNQSACIHYMYYWKHSSVISHMHYLTWGWRRLVQVGGPVKVLVRKISRPVISGLWPTQCTMPTQCRPPSWLMVSLLRLVWMASVALLCHYLETRLFTLSSSQSMAWLDSWV